MKTGIDIERTCNKGRKIMIEESDIEVIFFFDPHEFGITESEAKAEIRKIINAGGASGGSLERITRGEIKIYFNPLFHDRYSRNVAVEQMLYAIRDTAK
ncbi:hypothetical protein IKD57_01550 [Candidatus Saccharibacteria bacterium]|nr:hypothetical protein [Candidatus Saccharibacteria bacterium]